MDIPVLLVQVMDARTELVRSNNEIVPLGSYAFFCYMSILSSCEVQLRLALAKNEFERQSVLQRAPTTISVNWENLNLFDEFLETSGLAKPIHWHEIRTYAASIAR